jgi:hypothetical protein
MLLKVLTYTHRSYRRSLAMTGETAGCRKDTPRGPNPFPERVLGHARVAVDKRPRTCGHAKIA